MSARLGDPKAYNRGASSAAGAMKPAKRESKRRQTIVSLAQLYREIDEGFRLFCGRRGGNPERAVSWRKY